MEDQPNSLNPQDQQVVLGLVKDPAILTPIVLIGASAMIPIPFMDDVAKEFLEKRLFASIAKRQGLKTSSEDLENLTQDQEEPKKRGCAKGCLTSVIKYPFKKILRKVFYFLEIKRAVDQSTTALAQAWLFELALLKEHWSPVSPPEKSHQLRLAIRSACQKQGVKPLEKAVQTAFDGAKGQLKEIAKNLFGDSEPDDKSLSASVDSLEKKENSSLQGLTQSLAQSLDQVSQSYLETFANTFEQEVAIMKTASGLSKDSSQPVV